MMRPNHTIRWATQTDDPSVLADFFVANVFPEYISHGEIQDGRADNATTWSKNLESILTAEFSVACDREPDNKSNFTKIAVALTANGEIAALAYLEIRLGVPSPYAVLHDLLVETRLRARGIGAELVDWIQNQLRVMGVRAVFLESGTRNARAHEFFVRNGFSPISTNFMKSLQ